MPTNHEGTPESALSRRRLIGAAGLTAVGLATATTATTAHAEELDPNNDAMGNPPGDGSTIAATSVPALTAGYSYFTGNQFAFHSNSSNSSAIRITTGDGTYSIGNYVVCPLHIPAGTRVRELTVFGRSTGLVSNIDLQQYPLDGSGSSTTVAQVLLPIGATPLAPVTVACDFTIDAGKTYDLEMQTLSSGTRVFAFRIGAQPAAAFVPITPYRAYDSRKPGVPSPGILARLANRQVLVVNAIDDAGAIATANVIPSTARAVTYNLTATGTTGDNYLSIAPGAAASTTVSSINFGANQTIANAATVSLDSGTVKVFCGDNVGSTHFIIDITGYYI